MKNNFENLLYANLLTTMKEEKIGILNVTIQPTEMMSEEEKLFIAIKNSQLVINKLVYLAMNDKHDDIDDPIYKEVLDKIRRVKPEKKMAGLFIRSDYLIEDFKTEKLNVLGAKQVEINTISCAFLFMGPALNRIHHLFDSNTVISDSDESFINFVINIKKMVLEETINFMKMKTSITTKKEKQFVDTNNLESIAIMIDNDTSLNSSNIFEKLTIIKKLKEKNIDIIHMTSDEIRKECNFVKRIDGQPLTDDEVKIYLNEEINDKLEIVDMFYKNKHVFFIYYRWFYNYKQYSPLDIILRTKLECSSAISLPSVELQIIGLKVFQIRFKNKEYLGKFLNNEEIDLIYNYFGEFYPYNPSEIGNENINELVLKSLEEGGGNNLYNNDILNYDKDPKKVFLMKKINGKCYKNKFVKDQENHNYRNIVPEIGIMGYLLSNDGVITENRNAGYISRSKDVSSNECGVSCGFGALDSIKFDKQN